MHYKINVCISHNVESPKQLQLFYFFELFSYSWYSSASTKCRSESNFSHTMVKFFKLMNYVKEIQFNSTQEEDMYNFEMTKKKLIH